jgi:SAM-dependent methyltransferase
MVPENLFDRRIAENYEKRWPEVVLSAVVEPIVDFLVDHADDGPVLELAIGTGRIAVPLHQRGLSVSGIDLSPDMVAELRAKPGAEDIEVAVGDMATTRLAGTFTLAYLVANSLANLTTQDAQVRCFENAAEHLEPGGRFVIELYIPELQRLPPGETVHPFALTPTHLAFEEYDLANQIAYSHHYWIEDGRLETFSAPFRYVWPAELDLMARIAGMTLQERWSGWRGEPFTSESRSHVSVWTKNP